MHLYTTEPIPQKHSQKLSVHLLTLAECSCAPYRALPCLLRLHAVPLCSRPLLWWASKWHTSMPLPFILRNGRISLDLLTEDMAIGYDLHDQSSSAYAISHLFKSKDYVNYAKRKKRAAEKRDCLKWRSCEIHICNFEELYWSRGVNMRSRQKQWSPGKNSFKDFKNCDAQSGSKNSKRSGQAGSQRASRKDPFQFMWQTGRSFYTDFWDDFLHQDFAFAYGSSHAKHRRSAGDTKEHPGDTKGHPGEKKAKVEPRSIGSPSDRQTLGLSPSGSLTIEELKKAFRASALKWHPDRHEDAAKGTAEAKFKSCGAAYKSLLSALAKS